ncbi:unnamed protein product [Linum trigynum]|uniref:Uncharacterized protein n=1 Tax=Linum trigynum TaxID=586398 RepID=A0AAV2GQC1_9ROSI
MVGDCESRQSVVHPANLWTLSKKLWWRWWTSGEAAKHKKQRSERMADTTAMIPDDVSPLFFRVRSRALTSQQTEEIPQLLCIPPKL